MKRILLFSSMLFLSCQGTVIPPKGLKNVGSSCFMNVAFQTLLAQPELNQALLTRANYTSGSLAAQYTALVRALHQGSTFDLLVLCLKGWEAMRVPQKSAQDAGEFLALLLVHIVDQSSLKYDFSYISLPIPFDESCKSLAQCIQSTYRGSLTLPSYVILEVNRIAMRKKFEKHEAALPFALDGSDLTSYLGSEAARYILSSVIIHSGKAQGGHYSAYVKSGSQWYFCDDAFVTSLSTAQMATIAARGFGLDPEHLKRPSKHRREKLEYSKRQTPVLFFYSKRA